MTALLRITAVTAMRPYVLRVEFASGATHLVDVGRLVAELAIFEPLRSQPKLFGEVRVGEWGADLGWGGDMELSADTLWKLARRGAEQELRAG
ncbi:MAG: DUF2442 domain-containing protein [Thermodesulfobacteriota bacterium]